MYFQFLTEDESTGIMVDHIMKKIKIQYEDKDIIWNIKPFKGIGHLGKTGTVLDRKTGKLLNDLPMYLKGFDKSLRDMEDAAIIVVLDNDRRNIKEFREKLEDIAVCNMILCDHSFCVAIKESEAWLLGDRDAILKAYPDAKIQYLKKYEQDGICDTWEVLADIVCARGLAGLKKKAGGNYTEIGKAKYEWADQIAPKMDLHKNESPSFQYFISELERRI